MMDGTPPTPADERGSRRNHPFRPVLERFVQHAPARPAVPQAGAAVKLSQNESPFAPLPSVVDAIAKAAMDANRYPDNDSAALVNKISDSWSVPTENIVVGAGSVGIIQMLLDAVAQPGAEIAYAWRSFEAYPLLVSLSGMTNVQIPLRDDRHDLPAMAEAITERTALTFVCQPNNPTGTVVTHAELEAFLARVPPDCLVVLDEAYAEYVRSPEAANGLDLWAKYPNLVVLRTFSKAYGLAGLRVGYLIGHPRVAQAVRKNFVPFAVGSLAQAAAIASLDAESELLDRVEETVGERARVTGRLRTQGWQVASADGNFLWLPLGEHTLRFATACQARGVTVRPFAGAGARVSIGSTAENDAFLDVAAQWRLDLPDAERPAA